MMSRTHGRLVDAAALSQSGIGWTTPQVTALKVVVAIAFATIASAVALVVPIGLAVVAAAGYAGFILPSLHIERLARRQRDDALRGMTTLVEWIEALVASGRPVETAVVAIAERGVGATLVDATLRASARAYALGAPLFASLGRDGRATGVPALARLAADLERSRDLGRGALTVIHDERERLRATQRARCLDAAGRVEGRLMLILVLCYLPALMLLVVVPLFLGLLDGLFAGGG
jgi:tight adherence protein C